MLKRRPGQYTRRALFLQAGWSWGKSVLENTKS